MHKGKVYPIHLGLRGHNHNAIYPQFISLEYLLDNPDWQGPLGPSMPGGDLLLTAVGEFPWGPQMEFTHHLPNVGGHEVDVGWQYDLDSDQVTLRTRFTVRVDGIEQYDTNLNFFSPDTFDEGRLSDSQQTFLPGAILWDMSDSRIVAKQWQ